MQNALHFWRIEAGDRPAPPGEAVMVPALAPSGVALVAETGRTERTGALRIRPRSAWEGFRRLLQLRLVVPMLRQRRAIPYTARGVLFGLAIAMTPLIGIQMAIVFAVWLIVRRIWPHWDFSLYVALAWTWVSNVFTLPPIYYGFLLTGRVLMGDWHDLSGFDAFSQQLSAVLSADVPFFESLWLFTWRLFEIWGLPMFIGCIPWAVLSGWLGYRWAVKFLTRYRRRRAQRA